jgi:hypothetical protein
LFEVCVVNPADFTTETSNKSVRTTATGRPGDRTTGSSHGGGEDDEKGAR